MATWWALLYWYSDKRYFNFSFWIWAGLIAFFFKGIPIERLALALTWNDLIAKGKEEKTCFARLQRLAARTVVDYDLFCSWCWPHLLQQAGPDSPLQSMPPVLPWAEFHNQIRAFDELARCLTQTLAFSSRPASHSLRDLTVALCPSLLAGGRTSG